MNLRPKGNVYILYSRSYCMWLPYVSKCIFEFVTKFFIEKSKEKKPSDDHVDGALFPILSLMHPFVKQLVWRNQEDLGLVLLLFGVLNFQKLFVHPYTNKKNHFLKVQLRDGQCWNNFFVKRL